MAQNIFYILMSCCFFYSCSLKNNTPSDQSIEEDSVMTTRHENEMVTNLSDTQLHNSEPPQESKITNPKFPLKNVFGTWTRDNDDLDGPDFRLDSESVYSISSKEYIPYIINYDTITIFEYHDGIVSKGIIKDATNDSLIIFWDTKDTNRYVRWKRD